jgi:nicotinamide mononucleotide transporter
LNVYFMLASVYGMWCWRKGGAGNNTKDTIPITRTTLPQGAAYAIVTAALIATMRYLLARHTDSRVPTGDAFVTALNITGTYMLAKKKLEQWHVWIVANAATVALYFHKDLHLYAGLYIIYTAISFYGLWRWRKDMSQHDADATDPQPDF